MEKAEEEQASPQPRGADTLENGPQASSSQAQLISVLMPSYNREAFVAEAIRSILRQTYRNFELLIYDDGSTDNTCAVVRNFTDSRIRLIVGDKNHGVGFARNVLLDEAKSDLCAWMDSDDISNMYRLSLQRSHMLPGVWGVASHYIRLQKAQKSQAWLHPPKYHRGRKDSRLCFGSFMFLRDSSVRFDERITLGAEDMDWRARMVKVHGRKDLSDLVLYYYRKHKDAITAQKKLPENRKRKRQEKRWLRAKWKGAIP